MPTKLKKKNTNLKKGRFSWLARMSRTKLIVLAGFVAVFAGLGTYTLTKSQAATGCRQTVLREGSRGNCVRHLQKRFRLPLTNYYGPQTRVAITNYQRANRIPATGVVANLTWAALCRTVHVGVSFSVAQQYAREIGCNYNPKTRTFQ